MSLIALIPAGGVGERALDASHTAPKQYRQIAGRSMLQHTAHALLRDARVQAVHIGVAASDSYIESERLPERCYIHRSGGESRAHTVLQTLDAIQARNGLTEDDWVLVHDAARPGLVLEALQRLIDACLAQDCGGILALPVPDTVKRALPVSDDSGGVARIEATVPREGLWLAQTPQLFKALALQEALQRVLAAKVDITDEASAMEYMGQQPLLVRGHAENFKVTWPQDFTVMADYLMKDLESN